MSAATRIVAALERVPLGLWQMRPGLRVERGVLDLTDGEFRKALAGLVQLGLVECSVGTRPAYRLPLETRALLRPSSQAE